MRKHYLLSTALLLLSVTSALLTHAQISEGPVLITPYVQYRDDRYQLNDQKGGYLNTGLSAGLAVRPNIVAGLGASYGRETFVLSGREQASRSYSGFLFVNRFFPLGNRFFLTGNGILRYNQTDGEMHNPGLPRNRAQEVALALGPGLAVRLTDGLLLQAGSDDLFRLAYRNERFPANPAAPENRSLDIGLNAAPTSGAYFGLSFLIGR